jgi:glutamyl-tRNA reductase
MIQPGSWTNFNRLFVVGINFKKADVSHRNNYAISSAQAKQAYETTVSDCLQHFFVLSTCNRTEIYGLVPCKYILLHFLNSCCQGTQEEIHELGYVKEGDDAVEHFMTVAAGLDSQIPGDYEISAQIKTAFQLAKEHGKTNGYLERLVNQALQLSKIVKNTTSFSDGTLSVSYAVTQQIKKTGIDAPRIALVGLGEIGVLTLKNLKTYLPQADIHVVNRSEEKLQEAAAAHQVQTHSWGDLHAALALSDFVIVCTTAPQPIITKELLTPGRVKVIFDLSIPQNVAAEVYNDPRYVVMDIDRISTEINNTVNDRLAEIPKVKKAVKEKANEFVEWTGKRDLISLVRNVRNKLNLDPEVSNKAISETYSQYAAHFIMGEPGRRRELLETLVVNSFHEKIQETAIRKTIASLQTEVYASHPSNDNKRKPACFMANLCCHKESGGLRAGVQNHSC